MGRTDKASRIVTASPATVYNAFVDPAALVEWLPPKGMIARIETFEPKAGGHYRMALTYDAPDPSVRGKASEDTDIVEGRFVELVPNDRVVQIVTFESDDPAFAGEMKMTWSLRPVAGGTEVSIVCENVPEGISAEDHAAGLSSTLDNLAEFVRQLV
ncbi:SRPBCC family protein [Mesorhizobium sp. YR577]|uniref:SRPBCC family protein n=1 Tax=Mesorhizobium sp. YR577 TaxID=1884373 RepID=UPI000A9E59D1|nr:SRPBCC family protein [Mesorhizobium sp. YR577]